MAKYIAGYHLRYDWDLDDVAAIIKLVKDGMNLQEIEEITNRDPVEIIVLVDGLIYEQKIPMENNFLGPKEGDEVG